MQFSPFPIVISKSGYKHPMLTSIRKENCCKSQPIREQEAGIILEAKINCETASYVSL